MFLNAVNVYFGDTPGEIPETSVLYFHAVTWKFWYISELFFYLHIFLNVTS